MGIKIIPVCGLSTAAREPHGLLRGLNNFKDFFMSSLDMLQTRSLMKKGEVREVRTDTPIAVRLKYIGTGTITSVTVDAATDLELITSDGGTDTYAFATYTTIGALVDAINADGIFEAKVLDSIRSEDTASQFVDGAITAAADATAESGVVYYDVLVDTDAADYLAVKLTYDRGFGAGKHKNNHRVHLQEINYTIDFGTAGYIDVYEVDGATETRRARIAAVDNSNTSITFASGENMMTAKEGNDIVIYTADGGNLADSAANFLRASGWLE